MQSERIEKDDKMDSFILVLKNLAKDSVESLNLKFDTLLNEIKEVGNPELLNDYLTISQSIFQHISWAEEEIDEFSKALRVKEENYKGVSSIISDIDRRKDILNTLGPFITLWATTIKK